MSKFSVFVKPAQLCERVARKQEFGETVYQEDQEPDCFGLVEGVRHDDVEGHVAEVGGDGDEVEEEVANGQKVDRHSNISLF